MRQAKDHTVLTRAADEQRILITNDKDFGGLVFRQGFSHHGVLLLRLKDDSSANRVRVVKAVLGQYGDLLKTNFLVASETQVRIRRRKLPISDV